MAACSNRSGATEDYTALLAQPQILVGVAKNLQVGVKVELSGNFPDALVSSGWNVAVSPMVRWVDLATGQIQQRALSWSAAAALLLDWWAGCIPIRAENAAVARLRPQACVTVWTLVEEHTCIRRHFFVGLPLTSGAAERRYVCHGAPTGTGEYWIRSSAAYGQPGRLFPHWCSAVRQLQLLLQCATVPLEAPARPR